MQRRGWLLAMATVVFALALVSYLRAVPTTEFHRDEARWIHRAAFLRELRDPLSAYWSDRELMWGQPPLGSYLMGLGLVLQGQDTETNAFYDFHHNEAWNKARGAMPSEDDLRAARRTNAVVGALIAASAAVIAGVLTHPLGGLLAGIFLAAHPLAIYLGSLAGSDPLVTLCVALAALAAMALAAAPTWPRSILLGVLCGLGGSAKLSPLLLGIGLSIYGLAMMLWSRRGVGTESERQLGVRLLPVPVIAVAAFVVSAPYLWPDPIGRTLTLFRFRAKEMANQGIIWEDLKVTNPLEAVQRIAFWLGSENTVLGRIVPALGGVDLILAMVGSVLFVVLAVRRGSGSPAALALVVLGGQVLLVIAGYRADFARYLLPVVLWEAVAIGIGVGLAADRMLRSARERSA